MSRLRPLLLLAVSLGLAAGPALAGPTEDVHKLLAEGRAAEALSAAEAAVKAEANADALAARAQAHFELWHFDDAVEDMDRANALDSTWSIYAASFRARRAFYFGDDDAVQREMAGIAERPTGKRLALLLDPAGLDSTTTKHYVVHTDEGLPEKTGRKFAAKVMELIHTAYGRVFPYKSDKRLISRVYIFSSSARYYAFNQELLGEPNHDAAGYYLPGYHVLVVNADPRGAPVNEYGFSADSLDTMFHEGFHQFIDVHAQGVPRWFNEGVAEYFGPSQLRGKKLMIGQFVREDPAGRYTRIARIKQSVRSGSHTPLTEFLRKEDAQFGGGIDYAQGWSFVHFLLHSKAMRKKGPKLVKTYFTTLRKGGSRAEAHDKTFGKLDLGKLEALWIDYVKNL